MQSDRWQYYDGQFVKASLTYDVVLPTGRLAAGTQLGSSKIQDGSWTLEGLPLGATITFALPDGRSLDVVMDNGQDKKRDRFLAEEYFPCPRPMAYEALTSNEFCEAFGSKTGEWKGFAGQTISVWLPQPVSTLGEPGILASTSISPDGSWSFNQLPTGVPLLFLTPDGQQRLVTLFGPSSKDADTSFRAMPKLAPIEPPETRFVGLTSTTWQAFVGQPVAVVLTRDINCAPMQLAAGTVWQTRVASDGSWRFDRVLPQDAQVAVILPNGQVRRARLRYSDETGYLRASETFGP